MNRANCDMITMRWIRKAVSLSERPADTEDQITYLLITRIKKAIL